MSFNRKLCFITKANQFFLHNEKNKVVKVLVISNDFLLSLCCIFDIDFIIIHILELRNYVKMKFMGNLYKYYPRGTLLFLFYLYVNL